jgi:chromosomal replication initiator protein
MADCFVAGPENYPLVEALYPDAVLSLPSRSPVLFVGGSGTGKTSMAATLASHWLQEEASRKFTFTSALEFSRGLTRAIKADDMQRFRQQHRDCECLLLDNVHELVGKPAAQAEFLSTLDHHLVQGRPVVLTASDIPPLIPGLSRALLSRLASGHSILMRPPGKVARLALLERAAVHASLPMSPEALNSLAEQVQDDLTALELRGILVRWSHQVRLNPSATASRPSRVMDRIIDATTAPSVSAQEIAKAVSKETRVPIDLLLGPSRKSSVVRARGLAMHLMRQMTSDSYESIGDFFSGRDHTTVMHACKKTESELPSDMELSRIHDRIRQRFHRHR